eukprot:scaffold5738_cov61-Phaeocystis_antarctica.AAC.4
MTTAPHWPSRHTSAVRPRPPRAAQAPPRRRRAAGLEVHPQGEDSPTFNLTGDATPGRRRGGRRPRGRVHREHELLR